MAYYTASEIKTDLSITDTGHDTDISGNWGPKADSQVDDLLYEMASKNRIISSLPILPLSSPPESIKRASNLLVEEMYYKLIRNFDMAKTARDEAMTAINGFIQRLSVDRVIYGRIMH